MATVHLFVAVGRVVLTAAEKRNWVCMYPAKKDQGSPPPVFDCGLIINVNVRHETLTCNQDAAVNRSHFRRREIDRFRRSSTEDTWGFANFYRCSCLCWSKSERLEATAQAYVSVGAA